MIKVKTIYLQLLIFVIAIWTGLMIGDIGWYNFINAPFDSGIRLKAIGPFLTLFALFYEVYINRRKKNTDPSTKK